MRHLILAGLMIVFSGTGCVPLKPYVQGTKISQAQMANFVKGKTTKNEVVAAIGGPQDLKISGGKQIFVYKYQKFSTFAPNEAADTTFIFDENGVLEDVMVSRGSGSNPFTGN